ncbi:MAG: glycosyltransferase family 2 protein [Actinomycetota bacterium]
MTVGAPLFSVILPTFDRAAYLHHAIGSVQRQTVSDFELIVVDDGGRHEVTIPDDERIRVVRLPENRGPAAARNAGLAVARGSYVTFLDDDDLFTPGRLQLALDGLERAPITVCWGRFIDGDARPGRRLDGDVSAGILDEATPTLGYAALRRDLVADFDECWQAVEDVVWWLEVAGRAPVATVESVGYLVRRHQGPRNRNHLRARIDENRRLLDELCDVFAARPRARAFRLKRIGLMAMAAGDRGAAVSAFAGSWRARRSTATAWHLVRALAGVGVGGPGHHPHPPGSDRAAAPLPAERPRR